MKPEVEYLRFGLFDQQVCTTVMDDAELERQVNADRPTGLTGAANDWVVSKHPHSQPVPCADDPERRHVLLFCGGFAEVGADV